MGVGKGEIGASSSPFPCPPHNPYSSKCCIPGPGTPAAPPPMALLVPTPGGPGLGRPQANPTLPGTGPRWAWPGWLSPLPVAWLVFQPSFLTVTLTCHLMTDLVAES